MLIYNDSLYCLAEHALCPVLPSCQPTFFPSLFRCHQLIPSSAAARPQLPFSSDSPQPPYLHLTHPLRSTPCHVILLCPLLPETSTSPQSPPMFFPQLLSFSLSPQFPPQALFAVAATPHLQNYITKILP